MPGLGYNTTRLNNTNLLDSLYNGTYLNKTLQTACVEAGGFVNGTGCDTPIYRPDIFFFSVLLFLFTFFICMGLQEFRRSAFFPAKVNFS